MLKDKILEDMCLLCDSLNGNLNACFYGWAELADEIYENLKILLDNPNQK